MVMLIFYFFIFLVMWIGDLAAAFEKHVATYGGMDICINGAGISNPIPFYEDKTDGTHSWKHTVNVNLLAVIDCTHLAVILLELIIFHLFLHENIWLLNNYYLQFLDR